MSNREEQEALFNELVELSKTDKVRYHWRKREVAALLGNVPDYIIEGQVKLLIKALETKVGGGADENEVIIRELLVIALRQAELHRNAIKDL
jgi:hypothetical protein